MCDNATTPKQNINNKFFLTRIGWCLDAEKSGRRRASVSIYKCGGGGSHNWSGRSALSVVRMITMTVAVIGQSGDDWGLGIHQFADVVTATDRMNIGRKRGLHLFHHWLVFLLVVVFRFVARRWRRWRWRRRWATAKVLVFVASISVAAFIGSQLIRFHFRVAERKRCFRSNGS